MERPDGLPASSKHLPPRELWNFTPGVSERILMPVNHRGLVLVDELVACVKSTIDPSYEWSLEDLNLHHLYFDKSKYPNDDDQAFNPIVFRNLSSNQVELPEVFHNWLHLVMEEPPIPPPESMHYRDEAQRVTKKFLSAGNISRRMKRVEKYDEYELESIQSSQLEHFLFHLEAVRAIPEEYRVIVPPESTPETIDDMYSLRQYLGGVAMNAVGLIRLPEIEPIAA